MQKLHRLLSREAGLSRVQLARLVPQSRIVVDDQPVRSLEMEISRFQRISLDGVIIQPGTRAHYVMVHKPLGYVSATVDALHPTVVSLIANPEREQLHLAGRLDRFTSGLVLLTNDGTWSKRITSAGGLIPKVYQVTTLHPLTMAMVAAFAEGFYFHTEHITTLPAELEILAPHQARLTLHEGRYHQIKRMFHRVANQVVALHREQIGGLRLPTDLPAGGWRDLTLAEREAVLTPSQAPLRPNL